MFNDSFFGFKLPTIVLDFRSFSQQLRISSTNDWIKNIFDPQSNFSPTDIEISFFIPCLLECILFTANKEPQHDQILDFPLRLGGFHIGGTAYLVQVGL